MEQNKVHNEHTTRLALMKACAHATEAELVAALALFEPLPEVVDVRAPEYGLVMLRGRIGGKGNAFNIGEATVTRAVVRVGHTLGHGYLLGRSATRARTAAIIDALGQSSESESKITGFVTGVAERLHSEGLIRQEETQATRVDFFTLVRGEDA